MLNNTTKIEFIGNQDVLRNHKVAFLCSRQYPPGIVLKTYDWAISQREAGTCIISGFHSKIEQDVFYYLLKGQQPIILVLARGLKTRLEPAIKQAIEQKRLLVVTPFDRLVKRITTETASKRNGLIAEIADEVFVAYASPNGKLQRLISQNIAGGKRILTFDVEENRHLIDSGVKVWSKW